MGGDLSEEFARIVIHMLGDIKIEIVSEIVKRVGLTRVARAAGVHRATVHSALRRRSMGRELSFKVFKGLARHYPDVLKTAMMRALEIYNRNLESVFVNLDKLIEKRKKELFNKLPT